jgi:hypothetical protein
MYILIEAWTMGFIKDVRRILGEILTSFPYALQCVCPELLLKIYVF